MNKYILIFIMGVFTFSCKTNTQPINETIQNADGTAKSTFKVWGNCEMCKETIEKSVTADGVIEKNWDTESKLITITYDPKKISLDQIQKNISSAGYDNVRYKGDDSAYTKLPECCQYERRN